MTTPLDELTEAMARAIYERVNGTGCRPWRSIDHKPSYREQARAALSAIDALGLVVVPGEGAATVTMCKAALDVVVCYDGPRTEDEAALLEIGPQWDAMLAASPYRRT